MNIDINKIQNLLESHVTGYQIAQSTQITEAAISGYRNGKRKIENMTLETAAKLMKFIKEKEMEERLIKKLKNYMNVEMELNEFINAYDVTRNIANIQFEDEILENADFIWVVDDNNNDFILLIENERMFTSLEDNFEIVM